MLVKDSSLVFIAAVSMFVRDSFHVFIAALSDVIITFDSRGNCPPHRQHDPHLQDMFEYQMMWSSRSELDVPVMLKGFEILNDDRRSFG